MITIEYLQRFPFFGFMGEKQLKAVTQIAQEVEFKPGDVICEAHTPSDSLYFLTEGNLSYYMVVTSEYQPDYRKEYFIGVVNPEEIFGVSALIEPHVYTATLKADKSGRVIKINAPALRALCEVDSTLCKGLMQAVAKTAMDRLQMARTQLVAHMNDKQKELIK
jgi:CRP-like cAMP-binding protein